MAASEGENNSGGGVVGVIYTVACRDCKISRDLDKFYSAGFCEDETRVEMLEFGKILSENPFRPALLVDFMCRHAGHDCVFFWEDMACEDELDGSLETNDFKEDVNYWE
jgi:hypothetical protein